VIRVENPPDCIGAGAHAELRPVSFREESICLNIIKTLMDEVDVLSDTGRGARIQMIKYVSGI
jgi:hypothetical protein